MIHDTAREIEALPEVVSFFRVGTLRRFEPITIGLSNHNYAVSTDQHEYVVKFLVTQSPGNIENDLAIQQQLRIAGVGTPRYVQSPAGSYLFQGAAELAAVLSERIDGVIVARMSADVAREIGRHLALFHASVHTLPHRNNAGLLNPHVSGVATNWAERLLAQPLPRGIIHGDLHPGNVLVGGHDPNRIVAISDFEEAEENLYVIDLATTLMSISTSSDGESCELEYVRVGREGYESVRRLTVEEISWLPWAIRYASEAWCNWFRVHGFERYAGKQQRWYDSYRSCFDARVIDSVPS